MKTVLFIDTTSARYFRREQGLWRSLDKPDATDKLWVIANVPEEILESFQLPMLFGSDRSHFIERHLTAAFPHSQYRAATVLTGNLFSAADAVLSGLSTTEAVTRELGKLSAPVTGVWGISMLLTLMARRLAIRNILMVMPSAHYLRILVLKDGIPVITRCIHRYGEEKEHDNDANEIQRTRQHLENRHIFEHETMPPVLYLGNAAAIDEHDLLPLPDALSPKGDAAYLHPLFEELVSSPRGQLAPLQLRARHLAERVQQAAYAGIAASLLAAILFGQTDFRALLSLHQRESTLSADLQRATREQENLAGRIGATGTDPALVRQATKFAALEMEAAPTPKSIFQFVATTIADLPQVRIKSLTFKSPKPGERYCQGQTVIEVPLLGRKIDLPLGTGSKPAEPDDGAPLRYAELQFSILLTDNLTPAAQTEVRKRISAVIKSTSGVQLMQDPAAFSLINTLKGGMGIDTASTENLWCMSIPWKTAPAPPLPNPLPQAGEGANESLRESHVKGLP